MPMNKANALRTRVHLSYYILAMLLSVIFISIFLFAEKYIENNFYYKQLSSQLDHYIEFRDPHLGSLDSLGEVKVYTQDNIPDYLSWIEPADSVHFLKHDNQEWVALSQIKGGEKYLIAFDQRDFEVFESIIEACLFASLGMGLLVSFTFSRLFTNRVISPLQRLADSVKSGTLKNSPLTQLPDEIGFLSRTIADREHQLNEFLDRETLFTGDVSHELRTPLTVILGASEVLETQLEGNSAALDYVDRIQRTTHDSSNLVTAMLLLSRAPHKIDAPQTNLAEIIEDEVERYRYLLSGGNVCCSTDFRGEVIQFVRPELARVAFGNLIRNAFQYTDKGSVHIHLDPEKMYVEDTGRGVPSSMISALFKRFNTHHEGPGCGIGLSIVKRTCRHIGWQLVYESGPSGGSRFTINFNDRLAS